MAGNHYQAAVDGLELAVEEDTGSLTRAEWIAYAQVEAVLALVVAVDNLAGR